MFLPELKLSKNTINQIIESGAVYTSYLNGFGILYKNMAIYDEGLPKYINQVNALRARGVQTPVILSTQLLPETTRSYKNELVHMTKGVYVVEHAKGVSLEEIKDIHLSSQVSIDGEKETKNYIERIHAYLNELEKRANASQDFYDKLVSDIIVLQKKGMDVDLQSSHFFFDESVGFTIVDIAPFRIDMQKKVPAILHHIIFGKGVPKLFLDSFELSFVTPAYHERLNASFSLLYRKICLSLARMGLPGEEFISTFRQNAKLFSSLKQVEDVSTIPVQILEKQAIFIGKKQNVDTLSLQNTANL